MPATPLEAELLDFDFENKCKAYRLPDGTIAIVAQGLKLYLLPETEYQKQPYPAHWAQTFSSR